jgi:hypothetical protein
MQSAYGGTVMQHLLGHGVTIGISPLLCAFERDRAEQQTRDTGCEMRLFVPRSGGERSWIWCCRSLDRWHRQEAKRSLGSDVSLPVQFLTCSVTASGLLRRPAARHRSAFWTPLPEQVWAPAPECTAWHLGVAPTRIASPGVTRADREFKNGDSTMYQNKAILLNLA